MNLNQRQVQHLFLRAGFGQSIDTVQSSIGKSSKKLFDQLISESEEIKPVAVDLDFVNPGEIMQMSANQKRELRKISREKTKELNALWIKEMVNSEAQLREKMAFFWHDHFACRSNNVKFMQDYLDVIRNNSLGNFGDLLKGVSKSPAMLQYLNNQQNRKSSPNENFAREVMELFTLGRDQVYTEKDISEAARAFTGWGFDKNGAFKFRTFQHDDGPKAFLNESGNFDGNDILDILLKQKETAQYISEKWVRFFMNYEGHPELEKRIADALYESNYNIKSGLEVLLTSAEFYDENNLGKRIKSPIELIASMQRQLYMKINSNESLIYLERVLGQILFNPPNVAGWDDGKQWVDSSSLMFRINLPQLVFRSGIIQNQSVSFDDNDNFKLRGKLKKLETSLDSSKIESELEPMKFSDLANYLLQSDYFEKSPKGDIIDQIIYLTSKPEYQLC